MDDGYILMCHMSEHRDAITYAYIDLLNNMPNKNKIIAIIPSCCSIDEISSEFPLVIQEKIKNSRGIKRKLDTYYSLWKMLVDIRKKYKINHIFLEYMLELKYFIMLFLSFPQARFILVLHDPKLHEGESFKNKINRKILELTYFQLLNRIIVTYSGALKIMSNNILLKNKIHCTKVIPLYWMKEQEFSEIKKADYKIEYDFIFYGRIEEYKGLELLISAFNDQRLKNTNLLIVGCGNNDKYIKLLVNGKKNIVFINKFVSNEDLARYICKSKIVIMPYRSATGSQTVAVANYYNRLVLATRVGCFNEYISDGNNGFFIEDYSVEAICRSIIKMKKLNLNAFSDSIKKEYDKFNTAKIAYEYWTYIIAE